jgi:tetratricopeptide (TPR) repeat protein
MKRSYTCPHGHHWLADDPGSAFTTIVPVTCPQCGAVVAPLAGRTAAAAAPPSPERAQLPSGPPLLLNADAAEQPPPLTTDEPAIPGNEPGPLPDESAKLHDPTTVQPADSAVAPLPTSVVQVAGYEILGELGRGGMGVVYKARQLSLRRVVALKMILAGAHADSEELARFRSEAVVVARLQHPNIVQIHEIGEQDGRSYIALEFVEGGSLARKLAGKPLDGMQAAALVEVLARAMHYGHQRGVVHRDLKPANVLLTPEGTPKITDFGLAKHLESDSVRTRTGAILGTPNYMAPEQAAGRTREIGPAVDIYALGAILYEMMTGQPPFRGTTLWETLEKVGREDPVPPSRLQPGVPRDLETICLKCLAKQPSQRYHTALSLARDLESCQAGEPILARRASRLGKLVRRVRRAPGTSLAVVGGLVAILLVLVVSLHSRRTSQLASFQKAIQAGLEATDGTPAHLEQMEALIDQVASLSPQEAGAERERLIQRWVAWTVNQIQQPTTLADDDVNRIEIAITALAVRDEAAAAGLRGQLEARRRRWETVFELATPFANAAAVIDPARLRVEGDALYPKPLPSARAPLVLSRHSSPGGVELKAVFQHPSWENADQLGLVLNASATTGYTFLLRLPKPGAAAQNRRGTGATLGEARKADGSYRVQILRNSVLLREQTLAAADVPAGPLSVWVKRAEDRLSFQINTLKPLEFADPFPLRAAEPGVFGVVWPESAGLQRLLASRQTLATVSSPLEQGDAFYDRGQFNDALAHYRQQGLAAGPGPLSQEARYKEGLCQLGLNQLAEAIQLFQGVATETGARWPVLADYQLWLFYLGRSDAESQNQADAILERITGRGLRFDELAVLIPEEVRAAIRKASQVDRLTKLGARPEQIRRLKRAVDIQRLLAADEQDPLALQEDLLKTLRLAGQEEEALQLGREVLRTVPALRPGDTARRILEETTWILRLRGGATQALADLDRFLFPGPGADGKAPEPASILYVERARIHAALGQWQEAERDVDAYLSLPGGKPLELSLFYSACLLKGIFHERRGDAAGAHAAWRRGALEWKRAPAQNLSVSTHVYLFIAAARTDDLSDAEVLTIFAQLLNGLSEDARILRVTQTVLNQNAPALRAAWRTPRGREVARKLALREVTLPESYRLPLVLVGATWLQQSAMPVGLTPEQEALIWDTADRSYQAYSSGKLGLDQLFQLAATWKGTTTLLWASATGKMEPALRGPIAYLFGQRFLRLNKPKDAETFFRAALTDAPPDSPLRQLTQTELKRLQDS